jgi:hypothetical protein
MNLSNKRIMSVGLLLSKTNQLRLRGIGGSRDLVELPCRWRGIGAPGAARGALAVAEVGRRLKCTWLLEDGVTSDSLRFAKASPADFKAVGGRGTRATLSMNGLVPALVDSGTLLLLPRNSALIVP